MGAAIVLITHDLGMAERVMVMYAGREVEEAKASDYFTAARRVGRY